MFNFVFNSVHLTNYFRPKRLEHMVSSTPSIIESLVTLSRLASKAVKMDRNVAFAALLQQYMHIKVVSRNEATDKLLPQ